MTEKAVKPEIRFAGFNDAWEQRKLGDICMEMLAGGDIDKEKIVGQGKYPVIANALTNDGIVGFYEHDYRVKSPAVTITGRGDVGHAKARKVDFTPVVRLLAIRTNHDVDFIENAINTLKVTVESTGVPQLTVPQLEKLELFIPPTIAEEQIIGAYLRQLDNLITLHQRKYDKLTKVKKSMLEKMFPKNGANVPEIRFKGFSDAWEQRKLGEVLTSLQNNTLSRADLSSEQGIAKNVHYGDILVKFGEVIDVKTESLPLIADEAVIAKYKSSFLQNGDVIVADTAEDETVGKCTEIAGLGDEIVISGLHTIPYRPVRKFASGYLGYYMNSVSFHNQLLPLMQGIKVTSISKTALQNTDIIYPKSATEQEAIGKYFCQLDNLITLHQREHFGLIQT